MNDAHLHMVVNHFPIIGTILGLGILFVGFFRHNTTIKSVSYWLFIVSSLTAFASMFTGEGAESMVKNMPTVGMKVIHEHEEWAEKLAIVLYLLGAISIGGLYANAKNSTQAKLVSMMAIIVASTAVFLGIQTGTSGGEVRHTEIRNNPNATTVDNETDKR
jgi:uncharacterized membrane protein